MFEHLAYDYYYRKYKNLSLKTLKRLISYYHNKRIRKMNELSREEIELISHLPHCFSPLRDIDIKLSVLYYQIKERKERRMREIKFRAWDKVNCKMYDVLSLSRTYADKAMQPTWAGKLHKYPASPTIQFGISEDEEKNFVLMQYTGLKDKNGKEIYEGDILTPGGPIRLVVEWLADDAMFGFRNSTFLLGRTSEMYEIIGNIFENPELLKKGE